MEPINSYVFFDIEATGLPDYEASRTKITEFSMISCSKDQLKNATKSEIPRVTHKLSLCVNPQKIISPESTSITGLDNYMLEHENSFNENVGNMILNFLQHIQQPLCLVAHNGNKFDFPIFQKELQKIKMTLPSSVRCADSLIFFKEMNESKSEVDNACLTSNAVTENTDYSIYSFDNEKINWQKRNETTPSHQRIQNSSKNIEFVRPRKRLMPKELFPSTTKKKKLFNLPDIHERIFGRKPIVAHNAEADAVTLMQCAIANKKEFIDFIDKQSIPFAEIRPINLS